MIDKIVHARSESESAYRSLSDVADGATIMVGGFGLPGQPVELLEAVHRTGATDLTMIANNAGTGDEGLSALIADGRVRKMVCSYPRQRTAWHFIRRYQANQIELELVPQGTLAERMRAGGAGIAAFYVRTGYGTELSANKETRQFGGEGYVLEESLRADFAIIRAHSADRWGNTVYRGSGINFAPAMAAASTVSVVQVERIVDLGHLPPGSIHTPGIHMDRIVRVAAPRYVDKE